LKIVEEKQFHLELPVRLVNARLASMRIRFKQRNATYQNNRKRSLCRWGAAGRKEYRRLVSTCL